MKGGEKITQISIISSLGNLAAVPKSGAGSGATPLFASKFGDLFGASFGTVLAKKVATPAISLQNDPLAALQALLAQGVPPSAILDKAAEILGTKPPPQTAGPPDTGPPDVRAKNLLTALQALLAGVRGNLKSEQTNDLSGTHLAAGTPAKVPPARSEKSVATPVATASLRSLIASVTLGLRATPTPPAAAIVPSAPARAPMNPSATPVAASEPAAPAAPPGVSSDVLGRMLHRAVAASPIPISTTVATAARTLPSQSPLTTGIANQPAIGPAPNGDSTASPTALAAGLDHLVLSAITRSAQGDANNASSGFAGDTSSDSATAPTLAAKTATSAPPVSFASLVAPAITSIHSGISPVAAAPPAVDAQAIIEQVVRGMSVRQIADGSEIRMRLVPDHLGEVAVHLTVTGSSVNASVVAQNADVRQTLLANQHHLTRALENSGLKLTGFSVDVFGGNAGNQKNGQDSTSGFGRHYVVHELPGKTEEPALVAEPSFGPPQLAATKVGLLNHLV